MKLSHNFWIFLRKHFLFGLIVLLPFYVTVKFFFFIINYFDSILEIRHGRFLYFVPQELHPQYILGFNIPGLGFMVSIAVILAVGVLSRNYLGRKAIFVGDKLFNRIPFLRSVYAIVKETVQTVASRSKTQNFSAVVLFQYPRLGVFTIGFITRNTQDRIKRMTALDLVNVFVPTTPNPTSGYLVMVPRDQLQLLDLAVDEAFRLIVSAGMVGADNSNNKIDEVD